KVDEIIAKIEPKVAPLPITPLKKILPKEAPPPPPSFQDTQRASLRPTMSRLPVPASSDLADPFDVTSLAFEPGEDSGKGAHMEGPFDSVPTRDMFFPAPSTKKSSAPPPAAETPVAAAAPPPIGAVPVAAGPVAAAPEAPAPSRDEDLEETQSIRTPATSPPAVSDSDMFAAPPPAEPDLPEPPALFIAPAAAARAGEVEVEAGDPHPPSRPSLEPREFPPPYEESSPTPPAAESVLASAADAPQAEPSADEASVARLAEEPTGPADATAPTGRALADLYYAQGHYAEALQIYDDLVTRHPFDADLQRMRRDAEARLLPAASSPSAASADPGLERRLARVRTLKRWLGRIQGPPSAPGP
ncbi:MAG TPA: hypothetical protein VH854_07045, partial [Thermoanaerobaculia bacterium]|nr:hypothetical protein [Thermoanaerobaculia bacterium]